MNLERTEFEITLRPVPGNWRTPPLLRLRALLKAALRGYGFRATVCRPVQEAERRMGELLAATERAKGAKGNPGGRGAAIVQSPDATAQPTLAELGLSKRESAQAV